MGTAMHGRSASDTPLVLSTMRLVVCLLSTAFTFACGVGKTGSTDPFPVCSEIEAGTVPDDLNLVVILSDTMRRDRAGAYGGPAKTPAFDAFAREHLLFEHAFSQSSWTKPAMATLFTSLYPTQHGVISHPEQQDAAGDTPSRNVLRSDALARDHQTLAEALRTAGFRTAAIVANPWLDRRFGFAQGFDVYDDALGRFDAPGVEVSERGMAWLDSLENGERFFLYLHYIDAHRPYPALDSDVVRASQRSREAASTEDRERRTFRDVVRFEGHGEGWPLDIVPTRDLVVQAYDKGLEQFDRALAMVLTRLRAHPEWERTAVVILSDHGEALYEHGWGNHGIGLHDDEVAIPLVARLPGATPQQARVDCAVGLVDLMPSLCLYLSLDCPPVMAGASFISDPTNEADPTPQYIVSEGVIAHPEHRSIRSRDYKLIYQPKGAPGTRSATQPWSLYDLRSDPGERHDLLANRFPPLGSGAVKAELAAQLETAIPPIDAKPDSAPVDRELEERLKALGYLE